jgi:hypothetical protein
MASRAAIRPYPRITHVPRWLAVGFISGALAVLVFHQGALGILNAMGVTDRPLYSMAAAGPWALPQIWSLAFWGGVWGIVLAAVLQRLDGPKLIASATAFGAIFPTLVAWFVVAPLKHQPMAAGLVVAGMAAGVIVNAAWGLGTGIGLTLFGRPHARPMRA